MSTLSYYMKTERRFTPIRKYAWLITVLVAIGGQFVPEFGLLVPFIMVALMATSLFKGRYWCGQFCPHGSFYDTLILPLSRNRRVPHFLKSKAFISFFFLFFLFNLGRRFYLVYENLHQPLQQVGFIFSNTYLIVMILGGLLGVLFTSRTWCHFCPMGTIQVLSYTLGRGLGLSRWDKRVTIKREELCHNCGKCARICPLHLKPYLHFNEKNQFDDENCIRCNTCVKNCPAGILSLSTKEEAEVIHKETSVDGFDKARSYQAVIEAIHELKDASIREYTFILHEPAKMESLPGQFLLIKVDDREEMYRAYTISKIDRKGKRVSITVKRLEDGYGTNLLFRDFQEGDGVTLRGPMGSDLILNREARELLFIANGIGITPFVSMVSSLFEESDTFYNGRVTLLYGARYEEDLIYDDFFQRVEESYPSFNYKPILSRPGGEEYERGYVTHLLEDLDLSLETEVYICGSSPMASQVMEILKERGIEERAIHYEDFGL